VPLKEYELRISEVTCITFVPATNGDIATLFFVSAALFTVNSGAVRGTIRPMTNTLLMS